MEEALQILVQTSRTDDGHFNLASEYVLPVVLHLVRSLSCSSTRSQLFLPLRLLRNLCAGDVRNQDMFIDHDGVEIVSSAIDLFGYDLDDDSDCAIVRTSLQVLANSSLAGIRHQQAFLLQITSEILNERIEEIQVGDSLALYVLNIFKKAMGTVDFSSRCRSSLPTGSATIDVLGYSLAILRDTCAHDGIVSHKNAGESSEDVVLLLLSEGLVDLLLNVLQELEPPSQIRKMIKKDDNSDATTSENLKKVCPYKGFRRDIVSVIGNCAHKRKIVQDEVRDKNGVLLLLQQCVHDDDNPYLREWGLWTAWNLLGTNEENSKLVADLEYQESVDVPELLKAGLRVELDPQTRKPKLVNISE
ncbi:hypothetical protein V2J09_011515 [Rumex salicifolius]